MAEDKDEDFLKGPHSPADWMVVEGWLRKLVYKPGVTFAARVSGGWINVALEIKAFNSYRPVYMLDQMMTFMVPNPEVECPSRAMVEGKEAYIQVSGRAMIGDVIPLAQVVTLPAYLPEQGEDVFRRWLRGTLHEFERHEADEWFKEKGKREPLFDPHKIDLAFSLPRQEG